MNECHDEDKSLWQLRIEKTISALTDMYKHLSIIVAACENNHYRLEQSRDANSRSNKDFAERLLKLESSKLTQERDPKVWVFVNKRLDELELKLSILPANIENLIKVNIDNIWNHLNKNTLNKTPHKCPVCAGTGKIQFDLPAGGYWENQCHACEGKCIVWG